jgi:hypothetical protein
VAGHKPPITPTDQYATKENSKENSKQKNTETHDAPPSLPAPLRLPPRGILKTFDYFFKASSAPQA